jgi:hypothetical protein
MAMTLEWAREGPGWLGRKARASGEEDEFMSALSRLQAAVRGALWVVRGAGLRGRLQHLEDQLAQTDSQVREAARKLESDLRELDARLHETSAQITADAQEARRRAEQAKWLQANDLRAFEKRVYSQNGEDGIIEEILRRIGSDTRYFVEFGVESGVECNCARLVLQQGWRGLFIEGNAGQFAKLVERYRPYPVRCVQALVTSANIEALFEANGVPPDFDVLSIDIDGNDYWVWSALRRWRPRLVAIEYNPTHPPTRRWVMKEDPGYQWNRTNYFGASLASLTNLGRQKGYALVGTDTTGVNAFFVRDDLATPDRFLDPVVHYHYTPLNHPACPNGLPVWNGPFVEV